MLLSYYLQGENLLFPFFMASARHGKTKCVFQAATLVQSPSEPRHHRLSSSSEGPKYKHYDRHTNTLLFSYFFFSIGVFSPKVYLVNTFIVFK